MRQVDRKSVDKIAIGHEHVQFQWLLARFYAFHFAKIFIPLGIYQTLIIVTIFFLSPASFGSSMFDEDVITINDKKTTMLPSNTYFKIFRLNTSSVILLGFEVDLSNLDIVSK